MSPRPEARSPWQVAPLLGACLLAAAGAVAGCGEADDPSAPQCANPSTALFDRRIAPLLADERPTTCNQCHLSGIDLGVIVRDSPCEAMACLIEAELVDLDDPKASTILNFITQADPASELVTEEIIDLEYQAFLEWIEAESTCRACAATRCGPKDDEPVCKPVASSGNDAFDLDGYSEDCSDKTLEFLFMQTVYASRGRCYPCHFTTDRSVETDKWISTVGSCEVASLTTLRNVIEGGYVNLNDPDQSLLLLKPLSERNGGVPHGGHDKFTLENDAAYTNFLNWVSHYAACKTTPP